MIRPDPRYYLSKDSGSKFIGVFRIEEIAALLNAHKIDANYVSAECDPDGHSAKRGTLNWIPVPQLLLHHYKDHPWVTVVIHDAKTRACVFAERYRSNDGPWQVSLRALESYVDEHLGKIPKGSERDFVVYFRSEKCPPTRMTVRVQLESFTTEVCIEGYEDEGVVQSHPYQFHELSREQIEAHEFPRSDVEQKAAKYDPTAPLP